MTEAGNWLDRAVAWVSPSRGAARLQARVAIGAMLAYDGARKSRREDGWLTSGTSADAEISAAHTMLRERARDLVRNNPHAAKGVAVLVANKIGSGILAQANGANKRANKRLDARWDRFTENCDLYGRLDLFGIQSLAERTRCESGEALIRFVDTKRTGPGEVGFRLQVLEPDFIDSSKNTTSGEPVIRNGIEYDRFGVPTAYWLFDVHPGENGIVTFRRGSTSSRVPKAEILHYFKPLRAGQSRGVTDFASVMVRLRALDDYDDAELMRKKIAACLAAFVTSSVNLPGVAIAPTTVDAEGRRVEQFAPGMVGYLKPGEMIEFTDPKPSGDYKDFNAVQLHAIAAGLNMPYELLTGDLSEVTYTSHRGGLVQFRGMVEADQWQIVIPQLCRPIWRRFVAEANGVAVGEEIDLETPAVFTPPRFGLLDPAKEVPAMIAAIQGGIKTWPDTIRREGYDPDETLDEIEAWQRQLTERGIVITSDARTQSTPTAPAPVDPEPEPAVRRAA